MPNRLLVYRPPAYGTYPMVPTMSVHLMPMARTTTLEKQQVMTMRQKVSALLAFTRYGF